MNVQGPRVKPKLLGQRTQPSSTSKIKNMKIRMVETGRLPNALRQLNYINNSMWTQRGGNSTIANELLVIN